MTRATFARLCGALGLLATLCHAAGATDTTRPETSQAVALPAASGGVGVAASSATEPFPVSAAHPEPAIGRLNHAGYSRQRHCTMVAVGPRAVLTAAHCLKGLPASAFTLLFGYARMAWVAERTADTAQVVGGDLALLCLAEPVSDWLAVGPPPAPGTAVSWTGYSRPRVHLATVRACALVGRRGDEAVLDCAAPQGASGGPVRDGAGHVVAILSRTGPASAVATLVPPDIAARCD